MGQKAGGLKDEAGGLSNKAERPKKVPSVTQVDVWFLVGCVALGSGVSGREGVMSVRSAVQSGAP